MRTSFGGTAGTLGFAAAGRAAGARRGGLGACIGGEEGAGTA